MLNQINKDSYKISIITYVNNVNQIIKQEEKIYYEMELLGDSVKLENNMTIKYWD
ncbi:hypothetical protein PRVXT_001016 [Proteinivorax tanatarense]|uniref:Uncharacterized protein n=1 Tax=Proteinivorax tanatarense TaxID=1260629 RepID=A0AAU7VP78_9FIRM